MCTQEIVREGRALLGDRHTFGTSLTAVFEKLKKKFYCWNSKDFCDRFCCFWPREYFGKFTNVVSLDFLSCVLRSDQTELCTHGRHLSLHSNLNVFDYSTFWLACALTLLTWSYLVKWWILRTFCHRVLRKLVVCVNWEDWNPLKDCYSILHQTSSLGVVCYEIPEGHSAPVDTETWTKLLKCVN